MSKILKSDNKKLVLFKNRIMGFDITNPMNEQGEINDKVFNVSVLTTIGLIPISKDFKTDKEAIKYRDKLLKDEFGD